MGIFLLICAGVCDVFFLWSLNRQRWHGLVHIVVAILLFGLMMGLIHDALILLRSLHT
jgi:hypothetical protein